MSACEFANGLVPKDNLLSNLVVTDIAALCNVVTKTQGGNITSIVNTALPIVGDGSLIDPITVQQGTGTIPEYVLWENGTEWHVTEIQALERDDNVITVVNSDSLVSLAALSTELSSANAVKLVISASNGLNDQVVLSNDSTTRTLTIQAPNGDALDGTTLTATGSSVSIIAGNAGTTGTNEGGSVTISAGTNSGSIGGTPGTVTITAGARTTGVSVARLPNIFLYPGITPDNTIGSTVLIGGPLNGTDSASHLAIGGKTPTIISTADGYTVSVTAGQSLDGAGQFSIRYVAGLGTSQTSVDVAQLTFAQRYTSKPKTILIAPLNAIAAQAQIYAVINNSQTVSFYHSNAYVINGGNTTWKKFGDTLAPFAINLGGGDTIDTAWTGDALFSYFVVL